MLLDIFKLMGVGGLLLIITGVLIKNKNRKKRDVMYIIGGILLMVYSFHINDMIFITLQAIFILVSVYDLNKIKNKK